MGKLVGPRPLCFFVVYIINGIGWRITEKGTVQTKNGRPIAMN